jgi:hypothetical protein
MYAWRGPVARAPKYRRRSFFVDDKAVRRARKALGVSTDSEAVRVSVERVAEMEEFWRYMRKTRGTLKPGSFRQP